MGKGERPRRSPDDICKQGAENWKRLKLWRIRKGIWKKGCQGQLWHQKVASGRQGPWCFDIRIINNNTY